MTVLSLHHVSKRFPRTTTPAVADATLDVQAGEVLAIVGDSGSGKTTLLRMIAGFEVPSGGRIEVHGRTVAEGSLFVAPEARQVGMVFQDYALFSHFTVADNIAYGLHRLPRADRRERVAAMVTLARLEGLEKRYPHELSGGQQQRVALARALAPKPSILLLDEPFASLNDTLRDRLRDELSAIIQATDATVLLVTHDIKDAYAVADRVAIMKDGHILQVGTPEALYAHPVTDYVAHFFGKTNLMPATLSGDGLDTPIGHLPAPDAAAIVATRQGQPVTLSVRPENLVLKASGDPRAEGQVQRVRFVGQYKEVLLSMTHATTPDCRLTAYIAPDTAIAPGEHYFVEIRPDKVKVLDA